MDIIISIVALLIVGIIVYFVGKYRDREKPAKDSLKTVKLRNGTEEAEPLITVVCISLEHLFKTKPMAFYDLVMKTRDGNYQVFSPNIPILDSLHLYPQCGTQHESIRNVVLSCSRGEGLEMEFILPFPDK